MAAPTAHPIALQQAETADLQGRHWGQVADLMDRAAKRIEDLERDR